MSKTGDSVTPIIAPENATSPMTRKEAIINLVCTWGQRDQEFCVGKAERDESDRELNESLAALGVTAEEREAAFSE